jgi:anthranilate phosphoribosyltransferase
MVSAFVLLKVKRGGEINISETLNRFKEIQDVSLLYGEYDAILKVETKTMEDLQEFLVKRLRRVDGVDKTSTLITP